MPKRKKGPGPNSEPAKNATPNKLQRFKDAYTTREPLWKGPEKDGITFSLLSKFLVCRERFRLKVVEGLVEDEGFRHAIEYGSMWHEMEEAYSGSRKLEDAQKALIAYRNKLELQYPTAEGQIGKWFNVAKRVYPLYVNYWSHHPDEKQRKPLLEETAFKVPYVLPSGRTVLLRGKFDCVCLLPTIVRRGGKYPNIGAFLHNGQAIYLQENKTKGEIDEEGLLNTLGGNLQTMLYQIALRECSKAPNNVWDYLPPVAHPVTTNKHAGVLIAALQNGLIINGTLYNVCRRPLSDRYSIKQKKTETINQFYDRMASLIAQDSFNGKMKNDIFVPDFSRPKPKSNTFMRWKVEMDQVRDVEKFQRQIFDPILEQLCDWWEWIQADPHDPWRPRSFTDLMPNDDPEKAAIREGVSAMNHPAFYNKIHFQSPWGVYNSLAGGFRGDYFHYLTKGRQGGLTRIDNLYPELS